MRAQLSRRRFMQTAGAALATSRLMASTAHGQSASDTVNLALIGTGSRGSSLLESFAGVRNARMVALCDVDPERLSKAAHSAGSVQTYKDYRKLLERRDIDAVVVATPDHWHTPLAMAAILAGKHVYVEKPCSHNIHEANLLVKCAREHKKCVQHGTQRRSSAADIAGVRAMQKGVIGDVLAAKAINHQLRDKIGRAPAEAPPAGVDYDMWLGPAPKHPFTRNRWHYQWHWFWDYGGGDIVNDGIHQLDEAVWGLGLDLQYPRAIVTSGAQLWYDDDHQTPDTQLVVYEYPGKQIIYEMRLWTDYKMEGHDNGTVFYGTGGKLEIGRKGAVATTVDGNVTQIRPEDYGVETDDIHHNFVAAVRANDPSKLNSPIERGAVSAILCHLGNIGVRCGGTRLRYDPAAEAVTAADEETRQANSLIRREYRAGYELPYTG